ncbi:MAG: hypothetical protein AABX70_09155 [Nanoarchaeota archaeon]
MEKSSFQLVFGSSPTIKVIDFLIEHQEFDYSLTDIAKQSDIAWSTLHQFWPDFVRSSMVQKTRKIGRAELYKLNLQNPLVKKILEMDWLITKHYAQIELQKQKIKVKN